jgi:hypothetical protein
VLKKKIWANFQRIIELSQKIVTKLSKIRLWDPGVKKAPDPGSRIRIRNTGSAAVTHSMCQGSFIICKETDTLTYFNFDAIKEFSEKDIVPCSVADPNPDPDPQDPHVFGPPGSGSSSQRYGSGSGSGSCSGSGSFYHHAKIVRKTLIPTIL